MPEKLTIIKKDPVFTISFILALLSSCLATPHWDDIDWKVITGLFNLSVIILALEELKVMDWVSIGLLSIQKNQRRLSIILIALTFVSAMFITNDVALISFVPLTLIIARKASFDPAYTVILETLAANIGSSLTPMGNPQNLFLFSYYNIPLTAFLGLMIPFAAAGFLWLGLLNYGVSNRELKFDLKVVTVRNKRQAVIYGLLFIVVILSVLRILDYKIVTLGVILCILWLDKTLFTRVDYLLLGTFACFFIFIGNLEQFTVLNNLLEDFFEGTSRPFWASVFISQFISNVPCAILAAHYTAEWKAVLLGVNAGGMGTLVASMASVIAYKFYQREYLSQSFLAKFSGCNVLSLAVFSTLAFFLLSGF